MPTPPGDGYLHLKTLTGSVDAKFRADPQMSQTVRVNGAFLHFDGRTYPVQYAGEGTQEEWTLDFLLNSTKDGSEQWDVLRTLLDTNRGQTLIWQDHIGNVTHVSLLEATRDFQKPSPLARVKFVLRRVDPPVV